MKRTNVSCKCKLTVSNNMTVHLCFRATGITFMVSIVHQDSPTLVPSQSILRSDMNKIIPTSIHNEFMESKSWISYCQKHRNWIGGARTTIFTNLWTQLAVGCRSPLSLQLYPRPQRMPQTWPSLHVTTHCHSCFLPYSLLLLGHRREFALKTQFFPTKVIIA